MGGRREEEKEGGNSFGSITSPGNKKNVLPK